MTENNRKIPWKINFVWKVISQKKELQKNFDGKDFFTEVMIGLEEALDFRKGNARSSVVVHKRTEQMSRKQKN